ncbi:MAG: PEGA domain-containing protein, partial [Polyangia bacterium]
PTAARRDPRSSTGLAGQEPNPAGMVSAIEVRDENSLIFSLSDLKPDADDAPAPPPKPPPPPSPRRADVATNIHGGGGDFEENEATVVDTGDTLLARLGGGTAAGDDDRTRPAGPAVRRGSAEVPSGQFDLGKDDPAADADLEAPTLDGGDDDDQPTGAREMPPPRTHETRRVEAPLDDEDDPPTPQEIIDAPAALPKVAAAAAALPRQARPTPLGIRARHPNAPRPVNTQAPTTPVPPVAQPNAPAATLDEIDTRQRTRKAAPRPSPQPATQASFSDDAAEPTVSARSQQQQQQQQAQAAAAQPARPPSQKVQPLSPVPQASSAASTLQMPPSQNPMSATPRPPLRQSFDEPTRIPPAQPPPLDSGRFVPGLTDVGEGDVHSALSSLPLGEPDAQLRPRRNRGVFIALGILGLVAIGGVAAVTMAGGGGDGRGSLGVVSVPPGAEVRVDGVGGAQLTPLMLPDVDPRASHHVRVSKSGYDVWESDVKFPHGEREVRVQAVLVPTVGTVEIVSTPPGAEAIVDGRIRGMTPTTVGDLPPNDDVVIELRLRGYKVAHKTVSWAGKRVVQVSIPLEKAK